LTGCSDPTIKRVIKEALVETIITAQDLARDLPEVLDRVHDHGERFTVESNGQPIALIMSSPAPTHVTIGDFVALLSTLPQPDESFADDLEVIQVSQGRSEPYSMAHNTYSARSYAADVGPLYLW